MNPEQISAAAYSRLAYVYVRQSSLQQVVHHPESQRRQRGLVERAVALGWPRPQVRLVDEDLGCSAARSQVRSGFEKMLAEVAVSRVGIIVSLEVARISRGNRNWYHLLDICAITGTLIADADGLYDPRAYNDRLLLGLKGTMSEAELHIMKQRLVEAMRAKAQRGEFRVRLPPGYIWDEAGRIQKTPDEQVRTVLAMVFERFERLGTMHAVQSSLAEEGIQVPVLSGRGHCVRWTYPSDAFLRRVLKNPVYAGAYVYGRRQVEEQLDASQRPIKRTRECSEEDWHVQIQDHHEGYISWEQFERNRRQIASNRRGGPNPGAPREGPSLLQGLMLCGQCGRPMKVAYSEGRRVVRYVCTRARQQTGAALCQSFGAIRLERAVEERLLEALEPLGVEAMIEASALHANVGDRHRQHWQQRLERARYEVDLARRQYDAVDPANRLVARELEHRWETALQNLQNIEAEAETQLKALETALTAREQQRLRQLAHDLPRLWHAPTTRIQDKKRIARCLIEQVVVTVPEDGPILQVKLHWIGGEVTPIEVPRGKTGVHRYATDPELVDLVRTLAEEFSDEQIARILHRKKYKTGKGLPFTAQRVTNLRYHYQIAGRTRAKLDRENVHTVQQAAAILEVSRDTVVAWIGMGLLRASQVTSGAPWRVEVTEADRRRLSAADAPEGWLPLKGAAHVLGVSQQTVLQKLKSGELEGVRVRVGARTGWRIRVESGAYNDQPTLFDEPVRQSL